MVTLIAGGVPYALYDEARRHFSERELADLTWAVIAIDGWMPGAYRPHLRARMEARPTGSPART